MDYMKIYTQLRTGELSFNQFMDTLNTIYNSGVEKAHAHGAQYAPCSLDNHHYEIKTAE